MTEEHEFGATKSRVKGIDRRIARLPPRVRWAGHMARLTLREPTDGFDWIIDGARSVAGRGERAGRTYAVDPEWHVRLHERFGTPWPCVWMKEFDELWPRVPFEEVSAAGLTLGRGAGGGWEDGDPCLARAIWCLIGHLRPEKVVETGVARGVTSRVILEALDRQRAGHLWSIDLPTMDAGLDREIGVAVPERLRSRWTYIQGTSHQRLPRLLSAIAPIDLFVHDSSHTERNVFFELTRAWPALGHGAIISSQRRAAEHSL